MHPRIAELLSHMDEQREGLRRAVESVPTEKRETRVDPERWSTAEVLEHLSIVETGLNRIMQMRVNEAKANGLGNDSEDSPVLEPEQRSVLLDRSRKISAPERIFPTGQLSADEAWQRLQDARAAFRATIMEFDGLALQNVMHPHPVLGDLNFYQWLGVHGWHESRHAEQIREMATQLSGKSAR